MNIQSMSDEEFQLTSEVFGWRLAVIPLGFTPLLIPDAALNPPTAPQPTTQVEPQPSQRVLRPPNAFMLFRRDTQQSVRQLYKNLPNKEISKIIASMYANLTPLEKQTYTNKAQIELQLHRERYPDYKFKPHKRSKRPKMKKGDPSQMRAGMTCFDSLATSFTENLSAEAILQTPNNGLSNIKDLLFQNMSP